MAKTPARMHIFSYGGHTAEYDALLLATVPKYLIDNTAHSFWGEYTGNYSSPALLQNVQGMKDAGMIVIGYTTGAYEGSFSGGPNDKPYLFTVEAVKQQIYNMIVLDGCDGVFIDECSPYPAAGSQKRQYLKALADYAHSLGGLIWFNVGMNDC